MKEKTIMNVMILVGFVALAFGIFVQRKERFVTVANDTIPKSVTIKVNVELEKGTETITGSFGGAGVFIDGNNHVLTCAHLFDEGKILGMTVCNSVGECTAGDLLGQDAKRDLALVQAFFTVPTPYVKLANPRNLRVGQEVLAIGNPNFLEFSVCHGIVSALNRDIGWYYNLTQSDAMINPGNSGGPLVNLNGELIGINNLVMPIYPFVPVNTGLSFSVQPAQIIEFVTRIRKQYEGLPKYNSEYFK